MRNSRRAGKPAGKKPEKQGLLGLFTKGKNIPTTAQQTLPYREMYRDLCLKVAPIRGVVTWAEMQFDELPSSVQEKYKE